MSVSTTTLAAERSAALELLRTAQSFVLCGHVRPDGDCIGAEVALARVLGALGKQVRILNPDPVDSRFSFLERFFQPDSGISFETQGEGAPPACDVAVFLDFTELDRSGGLGRALIDGGSRAVVVDHHPHHGDIWWDAAYLDSTAAATGLLVHRIANELEVELDVAAAHGVFTSLVADTGWFKYSNTDAEVLRVASELVAKGVDVASVYRSLYQQNDPVHPSFTGRLLSNVQYHAGGRLAVAKISSAEVAREEFEVDDALDILRSVSTVEVVLVLRETRDGACRLSARSKGDFDVNALAREFGGGGHRRASGATLEGPVQRAAELLTQAASKMLSHSPDDATTGASAQGHEANGGMPG